MMTVSNGSRDHLRVCGADAITCGISHRLLGSSPRVRSRLKVKFAHDHGTGIISACAEQTGTRRGTSCAPRDHLRVCGADNIIRLCQLLPRGSSPRVRSRLTSIPWIAAHGRIISACAEQTHRTIRWCRPAADHLRVCGADQTNEETKRTRLRIISACAEQTPPECSA